MSMGSVSAEREGGRSDMVHLPSEGRPGVGVGREAKKVALEKASAETAPGRRENRLTEAAGQGRRGY